MTKPTFNADAFDALVIRLVLEQDSTLRCTDKHRRVLADLGQQMEGKRSPELAAVIEELKTQIETHIAEGNAARLTKDPCFMAENMVKMGIAGGFQLADKVDDREAVEKN